MAKLDFECAVREFKQAEKEKTEREAPYAVGQALLALGRPAEAIEAYRRYLKGELLEEERARIENHIRQLEASLRNRPGKLRLVCTESKVKARVDDKAFPVNRPGRPLPAGLRQVVFRDRSGSWAPVSVEVHAGEELVVYCSRRPPLSPLSKAPQQPPAVDRALPKTAWALTSAGIGLGTAAFVHLMLNHDRSQRWKSRNRENEKEPGSVSISALNELGDSINAASRVTVGLSVASALLTATGLTLFWVENTSDKQELGPKKAARVAVVAAPGAYSVSWEQAW